MSPKEPKKFINNFAFIDSQNLNLGIRSQGWILDFARFRKFLSHKYRVSKAFLFIGYVQENVRLYNYLENCGYELVFKPTIKNIDGEIKGNCDAELVLQAMIEYQDYHKAVIVSGDGDFSCLIKYLEEQEKLERLIIPNKKRWSSLLKPYVRYCSYMNDMKEEMRIK